MKQIPIIAVALAGASGMPYGLRPPEFLLRAKARVVLPCAPAAHAVSKQEPGIAHDLMRRRGEDRPRSQKR